MRKPLAVFHTGRPGGGFTYFEAFDKDEPGREREFPEASHAGELPSLLRLGRGAPPRRDRFRLRGIWGRFNGNM